VHRLQIEGRGKKGAQPVIDKATAKILLIFASVLFLDQITKLIALYFLDYGRPVEVIGNFFQLTLIYNPGGAFGTRLGSSTSYLYLSVGIFLLLCAYIYRHRHDWRLAVPLSIVAGGAAGNIIDRIRMGEVIDFFDFDFFNLTIGSYRLDRWPVFNVADMAVSCGIIATILLTIISRPDRQPEESSTADSDVSL
jgi:signal peptidase II